MKIKTTVTVMTFVIASIALASITVGATIGFPSSSEFAGGVEEQKKSLQN
jgi:hypothetical protein